MKTFNEFVSLSERPLTKGEEDKKEDIVKGMKKDKKGFNDRYGDDAESVMYATATKLAKEDVTLQDADGNDFLEVVDLIKPDPIKGVATEQKELEPKEKPEPTVDQEPSKDNEQINKKEKKVNMMKRQILMKKMQAVRSGAGGDIVAHHEPEGEMVEGMVSMIKKGAKRHAKAIEKKKIKNRKAVPYAALGASYEPEGEVVSELSRSTLSSYIQKGARDIAGKANDASIKGMSGKRKEADKGYEKTAKRVAGVSKAAGKLALKGTIYDKSKNEEVQVEGTKYGLYKGSGKPSGAMKDYLDKKAKKLEADKKKQKPEYRNNPAFGDPSHHSNAKNRTEEVQRDEYGDPIGGPKISKKQKAKNLSSNTPDEQHTTTTSEAKVEKKGRHPRDQKELDRAQAYIKKNPNFGKVSEAKVDKGRSDYGKATIRNWRHSGPSTVEPAMFDPENKRGKTIEKRRAEHKARRGVKGAKVPTYKKEEVIGEEGYDRMRDDKLVKYGIGHDDSNRKGSTRYHSRPDTPEQKKRKQAASDQAFKNVVASLKKRYGDGVMTSSKKIRKGKEVK